MNQLSFSYNVPMLIKRKKYKYTKKRRANDIIIERFWKIVNLLLQKLGQKHPCI